jgi:hypothetical protein
MDPCGVTTVYAITTAAPRSAKDLRGIGSLGLTGQSGPYHHCSGHSRSPATDTGYQIEFLACAQDKIGSARRDEPRSQSVGQL